MEDIVNVNSATNVTNDGAQPIQNTKKRTRPKLTPTEKLQNAIEAREKKVRAIKNAKAELATHNEQISALKNEVAHMAFSNINEEELIAFLKISARANIARLVMEGNYEEIEKVRKQVFDI